MLIPLDGLEPAAGNIPEPPEPAEIVDLSSLAASDNAIDAEVLVDEVIVDEVIVEENEGIFSDLSEDSAPLTDAVASESEGVALDLTGILPADPESAIFSNGDDTYTVNPQDTLWSIAEASKPAGLTTQQMMVALLETNPGAFTNGDMNQMRVCLLYTSPSPRDATLSRMPSSA